jgi:L-alanine-DL-glutamate epimerase-like enolase superfamily enzyme
MAADAGLPCVPHSANLSLVTVFSLHLLAAVPNAGPYLEYSIEGPDYYPWQDGLFTPALEVADGRVAAPEGPGWGVEIAPEWLARAEHRITAA